MISIGVVKIFGYSNKISNYSKYFNSTYTLIYYYYVNNIECNVSNQYGTSMISKKDTIRTVIYNYDNSKEVVIIRKGSYIFMILREFYLL